MLFLWSGYAVWLEKGPYGGVEDGADVHLYRGLLADEGLELGGCPEALVATIDVSRQRERKLTAVEVVVWLPALGLIFEL